MKSTDDELTDETRHPGHLGGLQASPPPPRSRSESLVLGQERPSLCASGPATWSSVAPGELLFTSR